MITPELKVWGQHKLPGLVNNNSLQLTEVSSNRESEQKPRWTLISEMVLPNTIGSTLISSIEGLGLRKRPETIFNQPIDSTWPWSCHLPELARRSVKTFSDVLNFSTDNFSSLMARDLIGKHLSEYLNSLILTPHSKLLEQVFDEKQYPIPLDRELELVKSGVVEKSMRGLSGKQAGIIGASFGLKDGIVLSEKQISVLFGISVDSVRRIKLGAPRQLEEYPSLRDYRSVPPQSFGRRIFNAIFYKDLASRMEDSSIDNFTLKLSTFAKDELLKDSAFHKYLRDDSSLFQPEIIELLMIDCGDKKFSLKTLDELEDKFIALKIILETQKKVLKEDMVRREQGESAVVVNNLFPEINLPQEKLNEVWGKSIRALGLNPRTLNTLIRAGCKKVGEILCRQQKEILGMDRVGEACMKDLKEKLSPFLISQQ